ncbi:lysophosphatidic acid phosphatase type 6 isoform X2 [Rhinatrema bivittatum]|uniref:lysophosphatidic acid phosphatase type 6 isoform X2 n=1 Tax=Rhinatrema bivittatum TaxID=194408 RepID=UPI00112D6A02|nr:lysophosphatidic acid phosphatase type 6 isoform X2 [Rhinatrema bivittatum]
MFYCLQKKKKMVLAEQREDTGQLMSERHEYELKLVQVIFRHGARTPLKPIPHKEQLLQVCYSSLQRSDSFPESQELFAPSAHNLSLVEWPPTLLDIPLHTQFDYKVTDLSGGPRPTSPIEKRYREHKLKGGTFPGQLTTVGMQQMFELGARLRRTYVEEFGFLSPSLNPAEVFVRSTNIVRNLESTRCLLAGLFQQQQQNGPVAILTCDLNTEILFPNYHGCLGLKHLSSNKMLHAYSQPEISEELQKLQQKMGLEEEKIKEVDFFLLLDNLLAEEAHGLAGSLVLKDMLQQIEQRAIDIIFYVLEPDEREVLQLSVGPFLYILQDNMLQTANGSSATTKSRKLFLYAVHDTTLIPLLTALGIFDNKWPPYAADLVLELYQHQYSKMWFVRLCYKGEEQVLKGCRTALCTLDEFLNRISAYALSPDEYSTLCTQGEQQHPPGNTN